MSLKDKLVSDMKAAMKAKDSERLAAIRFFLSAVKNKEIDMRPEALDDRDVLAVAKKMVKQMQDSIEQYKNAGRTELHENEVSQLKIIEEYLPKQIPREELEKVVDQVISEVSATTIKDMGKVMKATMDKTDGAADNKAISEIVRSRLGS